METFGTWQVLQSGLPSLKCMSEEEMRQPLAESREDLVS